MDFAEHTLKYDLFLVCFGCEMYLALAGTAAFERTSCLCLINNISSEKLCIRDRNITTHNDGRWADESGQNLKKHINVNYLAHGLVQRCNSMLVLIRWDLCWGRLEAQDSCWWNCGSCRRLTPAHQGGNILRSSKCNFSSGSLPEDRTAEVVPSARSHAEKLHLLDRFLFRNPVSISLELLLY